MKFCMDFGDTNFIGVANAKEYQSFVDEDWELDQLLNHFGSEMKKRNMLVCQMTEEGIEHSWNVEVKIGTESDIGTYFRKATGYINVTNHQLYLVDYDCLTMAAQFEDQLVPDENCSKYRIDIKNGMYKVELIQFYNVDQDEYTGNDQTDLLLNFIKMEHVEETVDEVFWCTY
ncbi:hypothetical protein PMEGAPL125_10090 [Priestia megaterium]